jgi:hypothetical protein
VAQSKVLLKSFLSFWAEKPYDFTFWQRKNSWAPAKDGSDELFYSEEDETEASDSEIEEYHVDVSESEEEIDRRHSQKYFYGKYNETNWKRCAPLMFALELFECNFSKTWT